MPPVQLQDIQAAVHKTAAGKRGQQAPSSDPISTAVTQDMAVLATQAREYSQGQAAGNAQAEVDRQASAAGLGQERAQSDTARAEELEAQRRKMQEIEIARRAAEQQAQLEMAAEAQRVALQTAEANERALQNRMEAARAAEAQRRAAVQDAKEGEAMAEALAASKMGKSVARKYTGNFAETFNAVFENADNMDEAREAINALERQGMVGTRPMPGKNVVNRRILEQELAKMYR